MLFMYNKKNKKKIIFITLLYSDMDNMQLLLEHIHQETGVIEFIEASSAQYNLSKEQVQKFTNAAISSVLGAILLQGDTPETEKLLNNYTTMLSDNTVLQSKKTELTASILIKLFNNKLTSFYSILAKDSQIAEKDVEKMTIVLSELFIKQLFGFMITEKYSISGLLGHLLGERDHYIDAIPDDVIELINISSKHSIGQNISADAVVVSNAVRYTLIHQKKEQEEANRKKGWFERMFKKS